MKIILILFFLFTYLTASSLHLTKDEQEYIKNKQKIIAGYVPDYEPYNFKRDDQAKGFAVELSEILLKSAGLDVEFVSNDFAALRKDLEDKKIDLITAMYKTPQREGQYNFSYGFTKVINHYITRNSCENITKIEDLYDKKVGVSKSWFDEKFFNPYWQIDKIYLNTIEEKIEALSKGQIDAFINDSAVMQYYIKKYGYRNLKICNEVNNFVMPRSHHFASNKDDKYLIPIMNKAYDNLSVVVIDNLYKKWFGKSTLIQLTDKEKEWIMAHPVLTVGDSSEFEPMYIKNEDGDISGIIPDFYRVLAKRLGMKVKFVDNPWLEIINKAASSQIDLIAIMNKETALNNSLLITDPSFSNPFVVYAKKGKNLKFESDGEIKNYRLAYDKNILVLDRYIKSLGKDIQTIPVESAFEAFKKVLNSQADIAVGFSTDSYLFTKYSIFQLEPVYFLETLNLDSVTAIRPDAPVLRSVISKAVKTLTYEEKQKVFSKWIKTSDISFNKLNEKETEYLKSNKIFNVCSQLDLYPLTGVKEQELIGYMGDIFEEISKKLNIEFRAVGVPNFSDMEKKVRSDECDMVSIMAKNQQKFNNMVPSRVITYSPYVTIGNIQSFFMDEKTNFNDHKFYVRFKSDYDILKQQFPNLDITIVEDTDKIAQIIFPDNKSHFIALKLYAEKFIQKYGFTKYKINGRLHKANFEGVIGININEPVMVGIINKALNQIGDENLNKIIERYHLHEAQVVTHNKRLLWALLISFVIILFLFYLNVISKKKNKILSLELKNTIIEIEKSFDHSFALPISIAVFDNEMKYISYSKQWLVDYGFPVDTRLEGKSHYEVFPEIPEYWKDVHKKGLSGETVSKQNDPFQRADGTVQYVSWEVKPWRFNNGIIGGIVITTYDNTKEIENLNLTKRNEVLKQRFENMFKTHNSVMLLINPKSGKIIDANKSAQNFYGYNFEEFITMNISQINTLSLEEIKQKTIEAKKHNQNVFIFSHKLKSGELRTVEVHSSPIDTDEGVILFSIIKDVTREKEYEEKLKELNLHLQDEIERKTMENMKQLQILQQQSKLAAMGEMIGAIAHQWRQPLNELSIRIQKLKYYFKKEKIDEEFIEEFINKNKHTIKFMSQTIDDFRNFFRIDKDKQQFEVKEAIGEVLQIQSAQLKDNHIKVELKGEEFIYEGFKSEFQQVIMNLLSNSKDAFEENNTQDAKIDILLKDNIIRIEDNAGGIPKDVINRVFEPYFTTKDEGKGTGLGLYMSKMIIEDNMKGNLSVEKYL